MLSRVADALFWMGRYLERASNLARAVDITFHLDLDLHFHVEHDDERNDALHRDDDHHQQHHIIDDNGHQYNNGHQHHVIDHHDEHHDPHNRASLSGQHWRTGDARPQRNS
jgi:uncharacterized alpha-E superfamily protein